MKAKRKDETSIHWLIVLFLSLLISFGLFGRLVGGEFVGDDHTIVENQEILRSLKNLPEFFVLPAFPDKPSIRIYRPLTMASYAFNFAFSDRAGGFHFLNILFHALNVFLVWLVGRRFLSQRAAFITAAAFAFLPIHAEAVAPIVARSEVLSVFFALLALLFFFKRRYIFSSVCFLAGLLSKDFVVFMLPLFSILLLLEYRRFWPAVKTGLWYLPPLGIYFSLRFIALGRYAFTEYVFDPVTAPVAFMSAPERLFTAFRGLFLYFRNTFWPFGLIPDYSYNQYPAITNIFRFPTAIVGLLFFSGLIWLTVKGRREVKIASLLVLVPFGFISNMFFVTSGSYADRWWYLPSFGLLALAVLGFEEVAKLFPAGRLRRVLLVLGLLILLGYGYSTVAYAGIWRNDRAFYTATAKKAPHNVWARSNLAAVYLHDREFEKSRQEITGALAIWPDDPHSLHILAKLYWQADDFKKAEATFQQALGYDYNQKNHRGLYRMLAFLYLDYGQNQAALTMMGKALGSSALADDERVTQIDRVLYDALENYSRKNPQRYTKQERDELIELIRTIRGF